MGAKVRLLVDLRSTDLMGVSSGLTKRFAILLLLLLLAANDEVSLQTLFASV